MKYILLFVIISLTFSPLLLAQGDSCTISIQGKVLDIDTKEPIPYASVHVHGEEKFATTNFQGEFTIEGLCSEDYSLIISCFGYCDSICHHHHQHGRSSHFYLTQKVEKIETVLIEAERTREQGTQSIAQISIGKAELRESPTQSLAASISKTAGVSFTSVGSNVQLPIIHGLYGNRILVLNNGIKHGFQNWSRDHAAEIDVSSAHSITILKGASGVRFGPEALGGAIVVESNPLHLHNPLYINAGSSYETNGRGVNSNVEIGQGFKKWSYFLNGSYTKFGDRKSPDYILTNSGREEKSFGAGTRFHYKDFDLKLYYSYMDQNLALLRSSIAESGDSFIEAINSEEPYFIQPFSYDINEPNQLTKHHFGKAEMSWYYSDHGRLSFTAGRQLNQRQEFDVRRNAEKPIIDLELITSDYQLEWQHPDWFGLEGIAGVQYYKQENRNKPGTGTTAFIPNYDTERFSAYLIESKRFLKSTIELGLRIDYEENLVAGRETNQDPFWDVFDFNNITTSIGYIRNFSDHLTFRTNLGTAWRSPNMAELYSFGQHGFKNTYGLLRYYTNEQGRLRTNRVLGFEASQLEAERGYKFINELEYKRDKDRHVVTAYSHYIENYIFDRPVTVIGTIRGPMPVFIVDQADALFIGMDYSWQRQWTDEISGNLAASYLWSRNIGRNEALINQAPIQFNYNLKWTSNSIWKFESATFSLQPSYTFQQFQAPRTLTPEEVIYGEEVLNAESEIFDFADAPIGYFLLNAACSFKIKNLTAGIGVENLLNQRYRDYLNEMRYFADELGANVRFSLRYQFTAKK